MIRKIKYIIGFFTVLLLINSCQDDDAEFGRVLIPTNLEVQTTIADDRSGNVTVIPTATNAINFHVFFEENNDPVVVSPGESASFRYTQQGEFTAVVTIVAFGTGGVSSSTNIELELDVEVTIDPIVLENLAGLGSKRWTWNSEEAGHFGVGPPDGDTPSFFSAGPFALSGAGCIYDDILTFSFDADGNLIFELETNGNTFINWAEVTRFFPTATPEQFVDECRFIDDQIDSITTFSVLPGGEGENDMLVLPNSFMSYWNGASEFEILELTENRLAVRSIQEPFIGGGSLAWYFIFTPEEVFEDCDGGITGNTGSGNADVLVWSEEFDVDGRPCAANWFFEQGTGNNGFGNSEEQFYTDRPENIIVEDGFLRITARRENFATSEFTSARINTKERFNFQYGRIEARARIPEGGGTWPAIWMLGADFQTNPWPAAGEIDIMEHVGNQQNRIFGSTHSPDNFGGNSRTNSIVIDDVSTAFHVYSVEWDENEIRWFVDDQQFHTVPNEPDMPFNKDFFILVNFAMGGTFGGVIDPAYSEAVLEVDYIRVFQ